MHVLTRVQRHLRSTGLPPTLFGRLAINDPRLVGDLKNGRSLRPATIARVEAYIVAHADQRHVPGRRGRFR